MAYSDMSSVAFTYIGRLQYRGRLLKQIATLKKSGINSILFHGRVRKDDVTANELDFPVVSFPVSHEKFKTLTFASQMLFCARAARGILRSGARTVVCMGLESLMSGVLARRRDPSLRLIFDSNELAIEFAEGRLKKAIWRAVQNRALPFCHTVIQAEQNRLCYFRDTYGVPDEKLLLLENLPYYTEDFEPRLPGDTIRVIYLGSFHPERYGPELVAIFATLPSSMHLDLVGFGRRTHVEALKEQVRQCGEARIRVLPPVPHEEIYALLKDYHVGLAFYRNTNLNNYYCAPNKIYDYIACGIPVISNDYPGLVRVLRENRIGVCIDTVNAATLREAIETIVTDRYALNITDEVRRRYSWKHQEARYLSLFQSKRSGDSEPA